MPPVIVAVAAVAASVGTATAISGMVIAGYTIGTGLATFAGAIVGMAISTIGSALIGQNSSTATPQAVTQAAFNSGLLLNKASNNEPIPVIYGSRRVGGTRVFMEATGSSNEYLHLVYVLSEGPISAINAVYLNDVASTDPKFDTTETYTEHTEETVFDSDLLTNVVRLVPVTYTHTVSLATIKKHLGADDQAADADLIAACPSSWTVNHQLCGVAYVYIKLKWNSEVFSSGLPTFTFDVDGRTIYDPRDATTKFSNNPPLCIRDYITNTRYGRGIPVSMVPDADIIAAANYCDELVTVGGVSQARYTCDGAVNVDDTAMGNAQSLLTSCRGMLVFSAGMYRLLIDKPETSTPFAFTEDNITGSWTISLGTKKNKFNRLRCKFFNPARSWQEDKAVVDSATLRADEDNGLVLEKEIDLPFTADINTAKQIGTINLSQSRQQIACKFNAFISGMRCEVGNVVTITHSTPGWTAKKFRVLNIALQNNDEVSVTAREYSDDVYDFGTIPASDPVPDTYLPDVTTASPPTGLAMIEEIYFAATGKGAQSRASIYWSIPADAFVASYEVEYKLHAATEWMFSGGTKATVIQINDLPAGSYDFRVRSVNTRGITSSWATITSQAIDGLTTPPVDITGFTLRPLSGQAHLQWDRHADRDVIHGGYIRIRHQGVQTGATWDTGVDIGPALPGSATNAVLTLLPGTYMAKAVDSAGNSSVNAVMAATSATDMLSLNYVADQDYDPVFAGTKSDMVVVSPQGLILDHDLFHFLLEDGAGSVLCENGDVLCLEDHDPATPVNLSGSAVLDDVIDLGGIYQCRVTAGISSEDFPISGYSGAAGVTSVQILISTTNDDPASPSAAWSEWSAFAIADYRGRGFRFKLTATTDNSSYNVGVTVFSAMVDVPDHIERGSGVNVPIGGLTVTFNQAFYTTPAIGISIRNMSAGDYYAVSGHARTGFSVTCRDSGGNAVARTIDWTALGYGSEITA